MILRQLGRSDLLGFQQFLECEARTLGKDPVYDNMDNPLSVDKPIPGVSCWGAHLESLTMVDMHQPEPVPSVSSDCFKERSIRPTVQPDDKKEMTERPKQKAFREIFSGKGRLTEQVKRRGHV